jgi:hypothetical protein
MEGLVEQIKQLTSKQQLHTREIQWISQLYDHVQQNIGLDLLDPPPTAAQICFKIIDLIYQGHSAGFQAESNSKNFVLPVDALIVSVGEIKSHATAYSSNLDNLWHDNFYSYLSPTVDRTISSQVDASLTSPNRSEWSQYSLIADHILASQSPLSRVKQLPSKPYLLVARFARIHGPLGLPLLALQDNTGEVFNARFICGICNVESNCRHADPLRMGWPRDPISVECVVNHHQLDLHTALHTRGCGLHRTTCDRFVSGGVECCAHRADLARDLDS